MVPWFTSRFQIRQGMKQNIIPVPTSKIKVQFFAETYFRVFKSFAKIRFSRKFLVIRYKLAITSRISGLSQNFDAYPMWLYDESNIDFDLPVMETLLFHTLLQKQWDIKVNLQSIFWSECPSITKKVTRNIFWSTNVLMIGY